MQIEILRLGHRIQRDKRITTHVFLLSRAFGAQNGWYTGDQDDHLEQTLKKIRESWGGEFSLNHLPSYRSFLKNYKGIIIHLTMYGLPHTTEIPKIKNYLAKNHETLPLLIIVGGPKVPPEIYHLSHYNVAIGYQPHSEISALALFLNDLLGPQSLYAQHENAVIHLHGGEKGLGRLQHPPS